MKNFAKEVASYAPAQLLPAIIAFFTIPILTRLFPPVEYAYWALASSLSAFFVATAVSGLGSAALRFYPVYKAKKTLDVFLATLGIATGTVVSVVAVVGVLALFLLRHVLSPPMVQLLPIVVLLFAAQSFFSVVMAVVRAQGRVGLYTTFQLTVSYGGLGLGLMLVVFAGFRVNGLLWGAFATLLLTLPVLGVVSANGVRVRLGRWQLADAMHIWAYAWPLTLGNVAMWGLRMSDLFVLSALRSEREVGLYSVSYNISAKSIELLVAMFLLSVSPTVYSTWEAEGRDATERTMTMITRLYLIVCMPAAVGLTVLAFPFVELLAGPEYYGGARIVGFVVFSSFAWGLSNIAMMGMTIKKQSSRLGANQMISASLHVGLQLIFVPHFGYVASAISTLIGYTVLLALNALASRPHLVWRFPFGTLRNVVVACAVMGASAWGAYGIFGHERNVSPLHLLLSISAAVPTYIAGLWLLGEATGEEKRWFLRRFHRVSKRK